MLHRFFEPGHWFAPKAYGIGAGWPIAWQGWAVLAGYIAMLGGIALLIEIEPELGPAIAFGVFLPTTITFIIVVKRRTRGGWRWRWGEWD